MGGVDAGAIAVIAKTGWSGLTGVAGMISVGQAVDVLGQRWLDQHINMGWLC